MEFWIWPNEKSFSDGASVVVSSPPGGHGSPSGKTQGRVNTPGDLHSDLSGSGTAFGSGVPSPGHLAAGE